MHEIVIEELHHQVVAPGTELHSLHSGMRCLSGENY
jgi:hypothetical protein